MHPKHNPSLRCDLLELEFGVGEQSADLGLGLHAERLFGWNEAHGFQKGERLQNRKPFIPDAGGIEAHKPVVERSDTTGPTPANKSIPEGCKIPRSCPPPASRRGAIFGIAWSGIPLGCLRGVGTAPVVSLALNHRLKAENPLGSKGFWVYRHRILEGDSHVLMVLGDYALTLTQWVSVK